MQSADVHILYTKVDPDGIDQATLHHWLDQLPDVKRAQIRKHRHHANQVQSCLGWLLVQTGMQRLFSDFTLNAVDFVSPHKSRSSYPADFNISHSGQLVAVAVCRPGNIGIDIEQIRPMKQDVIHKYFDVDQARDCEQHPARFFDYWTQKEAVIKAYGQEGVVRLRDVILKDNQARFADIDWYLTRLDLDTAFAAYIATDHKVGELHIEQMGPNYLI